MTSSVVSKTKMMSLLNNSSLIKEILARNEGAPINFFTLSFANTHTYLHLYYITTTIPQGSITIPCLHPRSHLNGTTFINYLNTVA